MKQENTMMEENCSTKKNLSKPFGNHRKFSVNKKLVKLKMS